MEQPIEKAVADRKELLEKHHEAWTRVVLDAESLAKSIADSIRSAPEGLDVSTEFSLLTSAKALHRDVCARRFHVQLEARLPLAEEPEW